MFNAIPVAALLLVAACVAEPDVAGRALYQTHCAGCHGQGGEGDGPLAAGLARSPADLTRIAMRSGGAFPVAEVMSQIDGYTREETGHLTMPAFGAELAAGPVVRVDTGDGIETPVPIQLLSLTTYLMSIQR